MAKLGHKATAYFRLLSGDETGRFERLRLVLGRLDGVMDVQVNFILDTVSVRYDADRLTRDRIKEKVDRSNNASK